MLCCIPGWSCDCHLVASVQVVECQSFLHRVLVHCEVLCHGTSVKEQYVFMYALYVEYLLPIMGILLADRQLRFSLFSGQPMTEMLTVIVVLYYLIPWLCGVSYALCLMPSLLQCGLDVFCLMWLSCSRYSPWRSSACPRIWGLCSSFYLGCFA